MSLAFGQQEGYIDLENKHTIKWLNRPLVIYFTGKQMPATSKQYRLEVLIQLAR